MTTNSVIHESQPHVVDMKLCCDYSKHDFYGLGIKEIGNCDTFWDYHMDNNVKIEDLLLSKEHFIQSCKYRKQANFSLGQELWEKDLVFHLDTIGEFSSYSKRINIINDRFILQQLSTISINNDYIIKYGQVRSHENVYGSLPKDILAWVFRLKEKNMRGLYTASSLGWCENQQKNEINTNYMHYLLAYDSNQQPIGYLSFIFKLEDNNQVAYCYDIQIEPKSLGKGVGTYLMKLFLEIGIKVKMHSAVLTCLSANTSAQQFFRKKYGFVEASHSPKGMDYHILSKPLIQYERVLRIVLDFTWKNATQEQRNVYEKKKY